jgi:hypothetical protein
MARSAAAGGRSSVVDFFLLFRLALTERNAPGVAIPIGPWGLYPPISYH